MKKSKVKPNDLLQRKAMKKAPKMPANATTKMKGRRKAFKKPAAWTKKGVKPINKKAPINKKKAHKKKKKSPRFYPAKFVEDLNCEFYIQKVSEATETLVKVYYSKDRKGLEYRYYRSFRPDRVE